MARLNTRRYERKLLVVARNNRHRDPKIKKLNKKAIHYMVLYHRGNPALLKEFERAIDKRDPNTGCIPLPKNLKARFLVAHRRVIAHVLFVKIWNWPDVMSHHQLAAVPTCMSYVDQDPDCFDYVSPPGDYICCNPYHWDRYSPPPPPNPIDINVPLIPPDLTTSTEDSGPPPESGTEIVRKNAIKGESIVTRHTIISLAYPELSSILASEDAYAANLALQVNCPTGTIEEILRYERKQKALRDARERAEAEAQRFLTSSRPPTSRQAQQPAPVSFIPAYHTQQSPRPTAATIQQPAETSRERSMYESARSSQSGGPEQTPLTPGEALEMPTPEEIRAMLAAENARIQEARDREAELINPQYAADERIERARKARELEAYAKYRAKRAAARAARTAPSKPRTTPVGSPPSQPRQTHHSKPSSQPRPPPQPRPFIFETFKLAPAGTHHMFTPANPKPSTSGVAHRVPAAKHIPSPRPPHHPHFGQPLAAPIRRNAPHLSATNPKLPLPIQATLTPPPAHQASGPSKYCAYSPPSPVAGPSTQDPPADQAKRTSRSFKFVHPRVTLTVPGSEVIEVPYIEGKHWCRIRYNELNKQIGESFFATENVVIVDGLPEPSCGSRLSIANIKSDSRNSEIEKIRFRISKGIKIINSDGVIYVENLGKLKVFVSHPLIGYRIGEDIDDKVSGLVEGQSCKVFDIEKFSEILVRSVPLGFEGVYRLEGLTRFKISFVKGWTGGYKRQSISTVPVWLHVHLTGPMNWVDRILRYLPVPHATSDS